MLQSLNKLQKEKEQNKESQCQLSRRVAFAETRAIFMTGTNYLSENLHYLQPN